MNYRLAWALVDLRNEINQRWPKRDKTSDGWIGDATHQSRASDHNPWRRGADGLNVVGAIDVDKDGIDPNWLCAHLFNQARKGDRRLRNGGYLIFNRRITNADWSGWRTYTGSNPHTSHVHISASTDRFDDRNIWGVTSRAPAKKPTPRPRPGGIETMAFNDSYRDWAGNKQTVQSWMNNIDKRLAQLHHQALAPGSVSSRIPGDRNKTNVFDMVKDSTAWTNQILGRVIALQAAGQADPNKVAAALRPVVADVVGPVIQDSVAAALGSDNQAQADAIVDQISQRLAERDDDA